MNSLAHIENVGVIENKVGITVISRPMEVNKNIWYMMSTFDFKTMKFYSDFMKYNIQLDQHSFASHIPQNLMDQIGCCIYIKNGEAEHCIDPIICGELIYQTNTVGNMIVFNTKHSTYSISITSNKDDFKYNLPLRFLHAVDNHLYCGYGKIIYNTETYKFKTIEHVVHVEGCKILQDIKTQQWYASELMPDKDVTIHALEVNKKYDYLTFNKMNVIALLQSNRNAEKKSNAMVYDGYLMYYSKLGVMYVMDLKNGDCGEVRLSDFIQFEKKRYDKVYHGIIINQDKEMLKIIISIYQMILLKNF